MNYVDNLPEIDPTHHERPSTTVFTSQTTPSTISTALASTISTAIATPSSPSSGPNNTIPVYDTSDKRVRYQLACNFTTTFCNKVSTAVRSAIDEFTRVVDIKNDLIIRVTYYNFCDKRCTNSTLAWGAPTSQFTLPFEEGADLNYVYPQALAKQLAPYSNTSVWADYDVDIEINHDIYLNAVDYDKARSHGWNGTGVPGPGKFWFQNDTAIGPDQVDLRYIVLHELLHGLGFISAWAAYFWTDASPFRLLVDGIIDPRDLQLVTPGPYWFVNDNTGPTFITGFQPTMIFDKYLVSLETDEDNVTKPVNLSDLGFDMQNFCVQDSAAFIINFVKEFNASPQSIDANRLWISMTQKETLKFKFPPTTVANSSYNLNPYLNQTYHSMTLLTGEDVLNSQLEQLDRTSNRPGMSISHVDDSYATKPDFLMTATYITGQTLEDLVEDTYSDIPVIRYNSSLANGSITEHTYKSAVGPGILRILDSMGYSTVLTKTNYTTEGNVKSPKPRSVCDDSNSNHGLNKVAPSASSDAASLYSLLYCYCPLKILWYWLGLLLVITLPLF
ncbi:uncharacterized protein BYT42DRAFT_504329 [Radiomyces spectabilis]|uniref:uncharacterized protein n=1 Tax=Radiomyces spectabilis TaxID=64574 RepID=UPI00222002A9|nr:uncharacterized protein BYT42DRAFT_504329 [Radiomyces spectabilis]KAI8367463.1 hypothetical protein BYT42DRAFT_504329 [Radiomyces spectabilis]